MYVIISYDVDQKRDQKLLKLLRRYCYHEQKSIFDGYLTTTQFTRLKEEINGIIKEGDVVTYYTALTKRAVCKTTNKNDSENNIIG